MKILTNQEVVKEVKKYARQFGLVFTKSNCNNYYHFHDFKTKKIKCVTNIHKRALVKACTRL